MEAVRKKVRELLRAGAEVIKVCSTGGVLSPTDHPEFTQFSPEELEVMVQEAAYLLRRSSTPRGLLDLAAARLAQDSY
mgnify:CR=1 FL=1